MVTSASTIEKDVIDRIIDLLKASTLTSLAAVDDDNIRISAGKFESYGYPLIEVSPHPDGTDIVKVGKYQAQVRVLILVWTEWTEGDDYKTALYANMDLVSDIEIELVANHPYDTKWNSIHIQRVIYDLPEAKSNFIVSALDVMATVVYMPSA